MGQSPSGNSVTDNPKGMEFHQGKIYFTERYLAQSEQYTTEINKIAEKDSVLLCVRAPVGIVNITNRKIAIGRGLCAIRPLAKMSVEFIFHWLTAFQNTFVAQATGTTFIAITTDVVQQQVVPIPPLSEQNRIVSAIESAVTIIDEIERNKTDLRTAITAAKSKTLDLAIRGKLVQQDPTDEPAYVLLERIRAEREALIKSGKIKRGRGESVLKECCDNSYYGKLPQGWALAQLDDVLYYEQPTSYIVESTDYNDSYKTPVLTAGKSFIVGHTNEINGICSELPVIIFDDFTTDSRYVDFRFKVKSSAMKILRGIGINVKYVFYYMQTIECNHSTHKRYWISDYSQKLILLPPLAEQHCIVDLIEKTFELLDRIIMNIK
ncbi:type I restriction endonuclease [Fibrobacteres bacterium R8-0-B4]